VYIGHSSYFRHSGLWRRHEMDVFREFSVFCKILWIATTFSFICTFSMF